MISEIKFDSSACDPVALDWNISNMFFKKFNWIQEQVATDLGQNGGKHQARFNVPVGILRLIIPNDFIKAHTHLNIFQNKYVFFNSLCEFIHVKK